jgi:hypothetical protein
VKRWWPLLVGAVALALVGLHSCYPLCLLNSRYGQLRCVIDHGSGGAHFTRGMNTETIAALQSEVSASDIAMLVKMLDDADHVYQMTAAHVLARMSPEGRRAVVSARDEPREPSPANARRREVINEALAATKSR